MKLFGTTTSPYVRRVRIVAAELGVEVELVNTATEPGQAALRAMSPIWKVPVAELGGELVFDSREIVARLFALHGRGPLAPVPAEANLVNAIDAATDAVISLFYLRRDGVAIDGTPFADRQLARTAAIWAWLAGPPRLSTTAFGLAEVSAICALDWMEFRHAYPVEGAGLDAVRAAWRARPSVASTLPRA
ncbi:MAG: glutathione S-transferase [Proteobacteria bacterium]|nr:glutathione S-transferase [Pseudomonadota bacterium]